MAKGYHNEDVPVDVLFFPCRNHKGRAPVLAKDILVSNTNSTGRRTGLSADLHIIATFSVQYLHAAGTRVLSPWVLSMQASPCTYCLGHGGPYDMEGFQKCLHPLKVLAKAYV